MISLEFTPRIDSIPGLDMGCLYAIIAIVSKLALLSFLRTIFLLILPTILPYLREVTSEYPPPLSIIRKGLSLSELSLFTSLMI